NVETSRDDYRTLRNWKEGRSDVNPFERLGPNTSTGPATTDVLEDANGQPYYRMDIPAGSNRKIRVASYGGGAQSFYTLPAVGQTYALRFRARRVSGTGTLGHEVLSDRASVQRRWHLRAVLLLDRAA
ncbi:hypothetical protein, partial [Profundibacterium mesophilum]